VTEGIEVLVKRLDADLPLPRYAHPGDAGADLCTAVDAELAPGERAVLPTGIALAVPDGYAAFVHPRSGLAARCGLSLVNSPGTVDSGYRGEVAVIVVNLDPQRPVRFRRGDRIAQLVVQRVERPSFREVAELPASQRSGGGFGSTGGFAAGGSATRGSATGGSATGGSATRGSATRGSAAGEVSGVPTSP
jgi:dUTP pyrophosphatase